MKTLGQVIKHLREERDLTQDQLAKMCGVKQASISGLESGRSQTFKKLPELAAALNLSVDDIVSMVEGKNRPNRSKRSIPPVWVGVKESPVLVRSFVQILSHSNNGELMQYAGDVTENTIFYRLDADLMLGLNGFYAPPGAILKVETGVQPVVGKPALYNLNGSPAIGAYTIIGGKPFLRPSNPQYQVIDVSQGELIGVIKQALIDA